VPEKLRNSRRVLPFERPEFIDSFLERERQREERSRLDWRQLTS